MLISVHLPKTAGTSFRQAIEGHYGDQLLLDYGDRPINRRAVERNIRALRNCLRNALPRPSLQAFECIHGHFLPLKYRLLNIDSPKQFVVWMRNPVERLASHYYYWQQDYDPLTAGELHHRVVEEGWSLERFCLGSELRNIYSKFLWGFPLRLFDFIGITEYYDEELEYFSLDLLGSPLAARQVNTNPRRSRASYIDNPVLRARIENHHDVDMQLYRRALAMRERRLSERVSDG